jgi:two-component sensor histidine kinase/uncharacterized pyridoxamine 5'-phosphate oxidase family protein
MILSSGIANFIALVKAYFHYIIFLFFPVVSLAQDFNYVHYDTRDGLAGSTVYRICQDRKGYIWFATDNGVSMFDGKQFKTFTTQDGLTDNDVLYIECDLKGRVWMMPFNKTVCYYYEGKIYNGSNDSTLKKMRFASQVIGTPNGKGEMYFTASNGTFLYKNSGDFVQIANFKELARQYSLNEGYFGSQPLKKFSDTLLILNDSLVFITVGEKAVYYKTLKSKVDIWIKFQSFRLDENLEPGFPKPLIPYDYTSAIALSDSAWLYNTLNGSYLIDRNGSWNSKPFLPGKRVSSSLQDNEGNLWFATIGEGIFRLTSRSMKTFFYDKEAFSLEKVNNRIYAGFADGSMKVFNRFALEENHSNAAIQEGSLARRLYTMKADRSGNLFLGFDLHLARFSKGHIIKSSETRAIKSIDIIDDTSIVICNNVCTAKVRSNDLEVIDTLLVERGTKVVYDHGLFYIGTLNGLVIIDSGKTMVRKELNSLLDKRVIDMCKSPDGGVWIATNDNGILLYKNNHIDTVINERNNLSSNICKSLFLKDNYLWVGTNKGLNKIDITSKKVLVKYSVVDGLASDVINAVYAEDSIIWVGTPAGITFFNEKDISDSSICTLDLVSITVSGKQVNKTGTLELSYKKNNISFDFTAISFRSAGDILYRYRLSGLDDDWKETRLSTLSYPSLPPGDYVFRLYAVNKFGKQSSIITIPFYIAAPIWKTIWFWAIASLLVIGTTWYLVTRRYKRLQQQMKERNELTQRMMELEQASLRAQMNPHFIFNCLNSIQHFMLKGDIKQTNKYISQFGSIIRQTMDNAATANISLSDEINYLTSYLELEQMRFPSSFHYEICLDKKIQPDYTYIPSMLLQPFVENAIRHGIRYKQEGTGLINIKILQDEETMVITIEDNGIGREAAARYKSEQHIEYQSKGITLTQKRIDILNTASMEKIDRRIIDLKDENGKSVGTKVVLSFPLSIIEKLN